MDMRSIKSYNDGQGYQMAIYYPFHSRASDVTFFESKWDKKSPPGNPDDGYSYVLTVIDAVSKYGWAEPTKDKTSRNASDAFERILSRSNGRKPVCLQTDLFIYLFNSRDTYSYI